jgi:hypothetical protein
MNNNSSRNIGTNYCLAWKTGGGTHLTLVYIENVKRGFQQDRVKRLVQDLLDTMNVPPEIPLQTGPMMMERCIEIVTSDIIEIQLSIHECLERHGFRLRPLRPPHIDLRGQSETVLQTTVRTRDWMH